MTVITENIEKKKAVFEEVTNRREKKNSSSHLSLSSSKSFSLFLFRSLFVLTWISVARISSRRSFCFAFSSSFANDPACSWPTAYTRKTIRDDVIITISKRKKRREKKSKQRLNILRIFPFLAMRFPYIAMNIVFSLPSGTPERLRCSSPTSDGNRSQSNANQTCESEYLNKDKITKKKEKTRKFYSNW